ncbi:MAG: hypothetical protein WBO97_03685, partial [Tepidiformaceae bacterium]
MTKTSTSAAPEAASFRRKLGGWYRKNGRHELPWRLTRDPYAVLVSEVMLQQTQVERVVPYYNAWLERWPNFAALAAVAPSEVIREWRGLGYNRRALNLHRLAVRLVENYGGALPNDTAELLNLPGVGSYTASAVRSFAREERVAVADTNIARVLARAVLGVASQRDVPPGRISAAAAALLPARNARDHNLALMDVGATICRARLPECEACPVRTNCRWNTAGRPDETKRSPSLPKFETTARYAR